MVLRVGFIISYYNFILFKILEILHDRHKYLKILKYAIITSDIMYFRCT